jgi:hypothetical protein
MADDDNGSFHKLRFGQAYFELRRLNRRERRRARKAAKNRVMFKTYGRRPWTDNNGVLYSSKAGVERMAQNGDDALSIAASYRSGPKLYRDDRRLHLREPCGFKAMSRLATEIAKGDRGKKSAQELSNEIWSGII